MKKMIFVVLCLSLATMMHAAWWSSWWPRVTAAVSSVIASSEDQQVSQADVPAEKIQYAVDAFKASREFNEVTVQQLLGLLKSDKRLVRHLLDGEFGYIIEKDVSAHEKKLAQTAPSVIAIYDEILELATDCALLDTQKNNNYFTAGKSWKISLSRRDKVDFLQHMHDTLAYYCDHFRSLQWALANKWISRMAHQRNVSGSVMRPRAFVSTYVPMYPYYFGKKHKG